MWQQFNPLSVSKVDPIKTFTSLTAKTNESKTWEKKRPLLDQQWTVFSKRKDTILLPVVLIQLPFKTWVWRMFVCSQWMHSGEKHVFTVRLAPCCLEEFTLLEQPCGQEFLGCKETVIVSSPSCENCLSQQLAQWLLHGQGSAKFGSGECHRDQGSATPQSKSETSSMWEGASDRASSQPTPVVSNGRQKSPSPQQFTWGHQVYVTGSSHVGGICVNTILWPILFHLRVTCACEVWEVSDNNPQLQMSEQRFKKIRSWVTWGANN